MENRLLSQMQQTMARKAAAVKTLESKSKALKNNIEPRNAYRKNLDNPEDEN